MGIKFAKVTIHCLAHSTIEKIFLKVPVVAETKLIYLNPVACYNKIFQPSWPKRHTHKKSIKTGSLSLVGPAYALGVKVHLIIIMAPLCLVPGAEYRRSLYILLLIACSPLHTNTIELLHFLCKFCTSRAAVKSQIQSRPRYRIEDVVTAFNHLTFFTTSHLPYKKNFIYF